MISTKNNPLLKKVNGVLIKVPSIEEGLKFYRDRLGMCLLWKKEDIAAVGIGDTQFVISTTLNPETNIMVESVVDAIKIFEEAGGTVIEPVEDIHVGKLAVVEDVFGNQLTLMDYTKGHYKLDAQLNVIGIE